MNLIQVNSGRANMRTATSELFVFFTPRPDIDGEACVETFVGKAAREMKSRTDAPVREHGQVQIVPALGDMPQDLGGAFATATYQVRDGTILKLFAKKRTGWDGMMRMAVIYVKARETAAHRRVVFRPVPSNALTLQTLGVQGRFDILTLDEVRAFGAPLNAISRKFAEAGDPGLFELSVLEEEDQAPVGFVAVGTGEGNEEKLMPVLKRRRRIEEL